MLEMYLIKQELPHHAFYSLINWIQSLFLEEVTQVMQEVLAIVL
jgi:hypothetical protein